VSTIGNLAVQQLLKKAQCTPKLEAWLEIPNLSGFYERIQFNRNEHDDIANGYVKYDVLDESTGDKGQVDDIVNEMSDYLPFCTYEYTDSLKRIRQHHVLNGASTARAQVLKTKKHTAATERALYLNDEAAAACANQQASTPKHHPKGKGGQKNPLSNPTPKKGSKKKDFNGNGRKNKGERPASGSEKVSGNKRKQNHQKSFQAKHPAKNQDKETDDDDQSTPKKKRQRKSKQQVSSTNNVSKKKPHNQRQQNQGGANKQKKRNS
jgi:hypothetical protein